MYPIILCIGTTTVIGDSVAPRVGDMLIKKNIKAFVYGTTAKPVNGKNLLKYLDMIKKNHKNCPIIAVDVAVGEVKDIGKIKITKMGIQPGGAIRKDLPRVGNIGIIAVTGVKNNNVVKELMQTELKLVEKLAKSIYEIFISKEKIVV